MSYNPTVKLYYIPANNSIGETYRIVPAPTLSIKPEIYYANSIAIGYTYIISLSGKAVSLDRRQNPPPSNVGLETTLKSIQDIQNLFFINNGTLIVTNNNNEILKATGGILKNISFEESNNNWVNYADYTIEIEFNELLMDGCTTAMPGFVCGAIPSGIQPTSELIDMSKYKIKSFEDTWSIALDENIYSNHSGIENQYFTISYNINAVGKNYFNHTNNNLLPSWEQAKNFCQNKLYDRISSLTEDPLDCAPSDGCSFDGKTLANLFSAGSNGILKDIDINSDYGLFNEIISVQASESDGSFNLEYQAIVKKLGDNDNAIHTYSITKNVSDTDTAKIISYNVQGSIQGLIPGGLINGNSILEFPASGVLFLDSSSTSSNNSKYYHASGVYYTNVGNDKTLHSSFVNNLNIYYSNFGVSGSCFSPLDSPEPTSFSLTHSYADGVITYAADYDGSKICSRASNTPIQTFNLTIQEPIPMIAEFIVPGRSGGPIIQLLDIETPRKYILSIEGIKPSGFCNTKDISALVGSGCNGDYDIISSEIPNGLDFDSMFLIENKYKRTSNGTYSLNRTYIETSE